MVAGPHDLFAHNAVIFHSFPGLDDRLRIKRLRLLDRLEKEHRPVVGIAKLGNRPRSGGALELVMPPVHKSFVLWGVDRRQVGAVYKASNGRPGRCREGKHCHP